jgi:ABC-2 type transport system permease protein
MKIKNILEITIKELKSFYDTPGGYLLSGLFLALLYFLFLKPFFITQVASLRDMFQWMPWMFIIFIPAITMGSFAKEYENQTIEYLLSKPLDKREIIIGKILGAFSYIFITVLLTTPFIPLIARLGNLDYSETFAGYLGIFLLTLTLSAIGVAVSSMFKNQITAFIVTVVVLFIMVIIGGQIVSINLPLNVSNMLVNLSITEHFYTLTRGVLKASDLAYFIVLIVFSVALAEYSLNQEKGIKARGLKNNASILIWFLLVIASIIIASRFMYGRIDLTSNKKYTLTNTTKNILKKEGKVTIEVYASNNLPSQFKSRYDELRNILEDYQFQGGSNLDIQYIDPTGKETELQQKGITPVEFRVYGNDQLQTQIGYLGLHLKNEKNSSESISVVDDVNQLEYQLSRLIYRLKNENKTKVAFANGSGERSAFDQYSQLQTLLNSDYDVGSVFFPVEGEATTEAQKEDQIIPSLVDYKVLIIPNPTENYTKESRDAISDFIKNGGSVIYSAENADIDNEAATAAPATTPRGDLFAEYGATVNADLLYDVRNHGMVTLQTSQGIVPVNYPFFVFAPKNEDAVVKNLPAQILVGWGSTLKLDNNWQTLYKTSTFSGVQTGTYNINPDQQFDTSKLGSYPVVAYRKLENGAKLFILSSARLFDNQFMQGVPENAVLALSLFEEAHEGVGLSTIKAKDITNNQIVFVEASDKKITNYGGPAISLILLGAIGFIRYQRKKNLVKKYTRLARI